MGEIECLPLVTEDEEFSNGGTNVLITGEKFDGHDCPPLLYKYLGSVEIAQSAPESNPVKKKLIERKHLVERKKMAFKSNIASIALLLVLVSSAEAGRRGVFDIAKYGGKANSDITKALSDAWKDACAATGSNLVVVPAGTYNLGQISLVGPCKGPIELHVQGILKAPTNPGTLGDSWVTFNYIDGFTLSGKGVFDGQGQNAWRQNDCGTNSKCDKLAINLRFNFVTNSMVTGVTSLNSKNFHVNLIGCQNLTFYHFTITAPGNSINTDGIHLARSTEINITDSHIATGDDCISLGDGSRQISVTRVTCGPGHGISVGSLGRNAGEEPVVGFTVKNCTFKGTDNGVRIKTWPDSKVGAVSDIHFEDIIMDNVMNPVLIDQLYCPWNLCTAEIPSRVKISKVTFKNIRGTSASPVAVKLVCSKGVPCEDVEISDINLTYNGKDGPAKSLCSNVKPRLSGKQNPPACTA